MNDPFDKLEQAKRTILEISIKFGPKALTAILILVAGFFVARWVGGVVQRWLGKLELEPPVRQLILRLVYLAVIALFGMLALQNLGVEL